MFLDQTLVVILLFVSSLDYLISGLINRGIFTKLVFGYARGSEEACCKICRRLKTMWPSYNSWSSFNQLTIKTLHKSTNSSPSEVLDWSITQVPACIEAIRCVLKDLITFLRHGNQSFHPHTLKKVSPGFSLWFSEIFLQFPLDFRNLPRGSCNHS